MVASRAANLSLYRQLMRTAKNFQNYNFRDYAVRYVRDDFRRDATLTDAQAIDEAYNRGLEQLAMLHRQTTISQLYPMEKHAMEQDDDK